MLYFRNTGTTTLTVWPEVESSYLPGSGSLRLKITNDLTDEISYLDATLLNTPTTYNPRLIFSITSSQLPSEYGLYTVQIQEYTAGVYTWGTANILWSEADFTWGATSAATSINILDNDRAYNEGLDYPIDIAYSGSYTGSLEYTGSLAVGTYTSASTPIPEEIEYSGSNSIGTYVYYTG